MASAIFIDAHVHIYPCFDLDKFLDLAHRNFLSAAVGCGREDHLGILMLTESCRYDYFGRLANIALGDGSAARQASLGNWMFVPTAEPCSVLAKKGHTTLIVVAGRQVTAAEDLEVLILGTEKKFLDGLPLKDSLDEARRNNLIHVIPWGAGKWLFGRGKLLEKIIESCIDDTFFLGDEGGRPFFWSSPRHFELGLKKGIRVLSGSDPLPFAREQGKAGGFGFFLDASVDLSRPAASLKKLFRDSGVKINPYGHLERGFRFFLNQFQIQCMKRLRLLSRFNLSASRLI